MRLRYYQQEAIESVNNHLRNSKSNPLVVIPTAGGKSPTMGGMIAEWCKQWPDTRVMVLAHVGELVGQNADKMRQVWPEADIGIYSSGLGRRDTDNNIIFASIQSVAKRAGEFGVFDIIVVDEAHRIPLDGDGQYRKFLGMCRRYNTNLRVIGFSATPYRLKKGMVTGEDYILKEICYEIGVGKLMDEGYLCRLTSKHGHGSISDNGLHKRAGEFITAELSEKYDNEEAVDLATTDIVSKASDRKAIIVFTVDVAHAIHVAEQLTAKGLEAHHVDGSMSKKQRAQIFRDFETRRFPVLVNVMIATEGYDNPRIDCVVLLRSTASVGLYYQMVGRGLRLHDEKKDCLVLDYGENIERHGPIDALAISSAPKSSGEAGAPPSKVCPKCDEVVHISVMVCPCCDHEWEAEEKAKHDVIASSQSIISTPETHEVTNVTYSVHRKPGKTPSMRVNYENGLRSIVSEWVCVEHTGYARGKALNWWFTRCVDQGLFPATVEDAIKRSVNLKKPKEITIVKAGKFYTILDHKF